MTTGSSGSLQAFTWVPQPGAAALMGSILAGFLEQTPAAAALAKRMQEETGTRFADWVDTVTLGGSPALVRRLAEAGFVAEGVHLYHHPGGIFPRIVLREAEGEMVAVALLVDSVADFLAAQTPPREVAIEGEPWGSLRRAVIARTATTELAVVERRGWPHAEASAAAARHGLRAVTHLETFRMRRRDFAYEPAGFAHAHELIDAAIAELGRDETCALFFAAEREYWQRRNRAAQVQKARQDRLGLGWGNHDHHTYRSSRASFVDLIALFERLGCVCRERFYAGREAGWGAQVMEQANAGIVIFADVDLAPEELAADFAHEPLGPREKLGTVGLWCGLHGEAFLEAGMHHLECRFDFEALRRQLESQQVMTMKPFTDLKYLRQAFTEGERWPVREEKLVRLLGAGLITAEQAAQFRAHGAIGSHLENLQRDEGYKGFNQKGVSEIIAATDPRGA